MRARPFVGELNKGGDFVITAMAAIIAAAKRPQVRMRWRVHVGAGTH
jgi:hypothetical protein